MKKLFVVTRGGIGDHFICNGIINHFSEDNYVYLACWPQWDITLSSLYCDNNNIEIHTVQDKVLGPFHDRDMRKQANNLQAEFIGLALNNNDNKNYMKVPYNDVKLPFAYMYSKFKLPTKIKYDEEFIQTNKPKVPYVLINIWDKIGARNLPNFKSEYVSNNLERVYLQPGKTKNLLHWVPIIMGADEIHTIPGGPCHLIDLICTIDKMFYHDARIGTTFNFNNDYNDNKWQIIKYSKKEIQ
jgi:hypothetical protein